jgi:general secretion pathway protein J
MKITVIADKAFHNHSKNGFTLIEILIAIFILGVILSTVYASYSNTLTVTRELEYESKVYKMARTTVDRMIHDLSSLQLIGGAFELRSEKEKWGGGEITSLYFWSAAHLAFNENEVDGTPALIGYFPQEDAAGEGVSLRRSDVPANRIVKTQGAQGGFVICQNVESLEMKFYDVKGKEYDAWDSSSSVQEQNKKIPSAILIELSLVNKNNKEKPYKFMTKIFLPASQ